MSENERELVLGNKQLLGIFFVATLLCGVFFAMGYVVGGNSAKSQPGSTQSDSGDTSAEGKREEPSASPVAQPAPSTASDAAPVPPSEPLMADNPAAAGSQPPVSSAPAPAPTVAAAIPPAPAPAPAQAQAQPMSAIGISVPEAGASYLQVSAIERPAADAMVHAIREKQFPAILTASPKPNLYRVLVGPYRSTLALADAKNKLKILGFGDVIVVKP